MAQDCVHFSFLTVTAYENIFLNMYIQVGLGLNTLRVKSSLQNENPGLGCSHKPQKTQFSQISTFLQYFSCYV